MNHSAGYLLQVQHQSDKEKKAIADAVELICRMLQMNPAHRPTALEIYKHDHFYIDDPLPTEREKLAGVSMPDSHALDWEHPKRPGTGSPCIFFLVPC